LGWAVSIRTLQGHQGHRAGFAWAAPKNHRRHAYDFRTISGTAENPAGDLIELNPRAAGWKRAFAVFEQFRAFFRAGPQVCWLIDGGWDWRCPIGAKKKIREGGRKIPPRRWPRAGAEFAAPARIFTERADVGGPVFA